MARRFLRRLFPQPNQPPSPQPQSQPQPPQQNSFNTTPNLSRALLEAPGIDSSTCQVNGPPTNPNKLPILPRDHQTLYSKDNQGTNPQQQSPFFAKLPPEIRQLIYLHAFGNRQIHIDFDYHAPNGRWEWWHRICDEPQNCPEGKAFVCPEYAGAEEAMLELGSSAWLMYMFEYKVDAVRWLRCCRRGYMELLPILYGSQTFVLTHNIDQLFRFSQTMPRDHLSLITSLNIELDFCRISCSPPAIDNDKVNPIYRSVFEILLQLFPRLSDLKLSLVWLPKPEYEVQWLEEHELEWVGPWEELARSREWKRLDISVPRTWFGEFETLVERRSQGDGHLGYKLTVGSDFTSPKGW